MVAGPKNGILPCSVIIIFFVDISTIKTIKFGAIFFHCSPEIEAYVFMKSFYRGGGGTSPLLPSPGQGGTAAPAYTPCSGTLEVICESYFKLPNTNYKIICPRPTIPKQQ